MFVHCCVHILRSSKYFSLLKLDYQFIHGLSAHTFVCSSLFSVTLCKLGFFPLLTQLMIKIGNDKANQLLEHKLPEDDKICPEADTYV